MGNTFGDPGGPGKKSVHPHACGEHCGRSAWKSINAAVHPHACGEHCFFVFFVCFISGSSPRLWGTHFPFPKPENLKRFIPTPVGNTYSLEIIRPPRTVHPHACGEHGVRAAALAKSFGSSPRLWGTQLLLVS
ncbi:hypothetical protein D1AOALGA4SA_11480 [Olavius algarvensis Delta 1 endosymbiont]|nr:hypothetical protein D1AOALGA4SA_11480 [Olavius algarvensis Delta 1 endosymbiont]